MYPPFRIAGQTVPIEWVEDTADSPPKAFRWHTDLPWEPRPPKFGMLSGIVAPDAGGDTVWADSRGVFDAPSAGYARLLELVRSLEPTVVVVAYGRNESFAGPKGVNAFREQLARLCGDLRADRGDAEDPSEPQNRLPPPVSESGVSVP